MAGRRGGSLYGGAVDKGGVRLLGVGAGGGAVTPLGIAWVCGLRGTAPGKAPGMTGSRGGLRYAGVVHKGAFRFMVLPAVGLAEPTRVMAWIYALPFRDPDIAVGPSCLRLPVILLLAFLIDVLPRTVWRSRGPS